MFYELDSIIIKNDLRAFDSIVYSFFIATWTFVMNKFNL